MKQLNHAQKHWEYTVDDKVMKTFKTKRQAIKWLEDQNIICAKGWFI